MIEIDSDVFQQFAREISEHAGIQLSEKHHQMLQNRIRHRLRDLGLESYAAYLEEVRRDESGRERMTLIDAVTTNYTSFFRDARQFEHLQEHLLGLLSRRPERVRIWSAACSTGEESYSLAITACEAIRQAKSNSNCIRILATDIAQSVLQHAETGRYRGRQVDQLSETQQQYFQPLAVNSEPGNELQKDRLLTHEVTKCLKEMVIFRRANLCDQDWNIPRNIDVIFLRNVLIYFDEPMQRIILEKCRERLNPHGLLYVGASESVGHLMPKMQPISASIFTHASVRDATLLGATVSQPTLEQLSSGGSK